MQVVATEKGYFGALREAGDSFDVPDGSRASWFKPVETSAEKPVETPAPKGRAAKPAPKVSDDDEPVI